LSRRLPDTAESQTERVSAPWRRWLVRMACLAAAVLALLAILPWPRAAVFVPALSPLVAFASAVSARHVEPILLAGFAVAAVCVVRHRWFCRWACPPGLCADTASRLGSKLGRRCPRTPRFGPAIAIVILGGACLGYPVLLWLDPLAWFAGLFTPFSQPAVPGARWLLVGGASVILLSLLLPGIWCHRLCPLGGLQDALWTTARRLRPSRWRRSTDPAADRSWRFPRRAVLAGAVGAVWASAVRHAGATGPRPLRPPGSVDEGRFAGICIRCGNCIRACPTRVIEPDLGQNGIAGLLAPMVRFTKDYCLEDCVRCTEVCPSGAIGQLTTETKLHARIGLPQVDMDHCLLGDDRECAICRNRCPYEAISLKFSEEHYTLEPRVNYERCPGCGACEVACPTEPKSIFVRPA